MPFPATPSPFRLSRRQPSTRRGAGPQFSNSPRFLLSQSTPKRNNDLEIDDDGDTDAPPSTARASRTPAPSHDPLPTPYRQREVIEDSDNDDDDWIATEALARSERDRDDVVDDAINSMPSVTPQTPGPFDEEFDSIFAPELDGKKRRRLEKMKVHSLGPRHGKKGPFAPVSPAPQPNLGPTDREANVQGTPAPRAKFSNSGISTPGPTKTPFRSKPRFMLSKEPQNTQSPFRGDTPLLSQPTSPPPDRRKPNFILPRSPSPSAVAEDIPAPFSPSSRALRRRGRPRAGAEVYAPGGMAAEARSWVLEMGSKREAMSTSALQPDQVRGTRKYLKTCRVTHANQAILSSSGPLAFIQAVNEEGPEEGNQKEILHIMTMGLPRSKPTSRGIEPGFGHSVAIKAGDLLGIHHGLTWNLELQGFPSLFSSLDSTKVLQTLQPPDDPGSALKKDWLVAMEWDIIEP